MNPPPQPDRPRRTFLFLQGPSSLLFSRIADRLEALGHRCLRINLCAGDRVFWRRKGALDYRGRQEDWPAFIEAYMSREGVTNLVLLGEERPYHRAASRLAKAAGVQVQTIEMGYLRPDWIRVERGGSGYNSHFPADPETVLAGAEGLDPPDFTHHYTQTFFADAGSDLLFNLPNVFAWFLYPHYKRHAIYHPLAEYAGWLRRLALARWRTAHAQEAVNRLASGDAPFFVVPLQLETDYQIRAYSPYRSQREAILEIVESFAAHAPKGARLLFKIHPLDNGLVGWGSIVAGHARRLGLGGRAEVIDGGNLSRLLDHCAGVVTINSTAGIQALQHGRPVKVLGIAIYDIPGLVAQGSLDAFWASPPLPRPDLTEAFIRLIAAALHVRGNFYSVAGVEAGAAALAMRLHEDRVNQPGGFVEMPPHPPPAKDVR